MIKRPFQTMSSLAFFTMLTLIVPGMGMANQACQSTENLSCSVYKGCIEAKCNCAVTASPYSGTFGPKYCGRFASESNFSKAGQEWRKKTLLCLKDKIQVSYVNNSEPCNCKQIQKEAIDSHSACYLAKPSFCKLEEADIRVIARIVDAKDILALGFPGLAEMGITLATCYWSESIASGNTIARAFVHETIIEGTETATAVGKDVLDGAINHAIESGKEEARKQIEKLKEEFFPIVLPLK